MKMHVGPDGILINKWDSLKEMASHVVKSGLLSCSKCKSSDIVPQKVERKGKYYVAWYKCDKCGEETGCKIEIEAARHCYFKSVEEDAPVWKESV